MYRYDAIDQALVNERVAQFRDQTRRFLAGELTEDEFRPLRLRNGLYIQRYAPMLRIAIPYGLLSTRQLRMLAHIARRYDRGFGHFTTRQNLQFNWPKLEDVPDILADLASVEMHAMQTSGNCVRNITADHLAGVAADEIDDPRPYCEIVRQWSTLHPEFSYLPRKFKIAVTGAPQDRAASEVHDIGLHLKRAPNAAGSSADGSSAIGFEILVGGGLGRQPIIGQMIREFVPLADLLSYLEAILRVYNEEGRRDNINKARIKVLVKALGIEEFRRRVEAEWEQIRDSALKLEAAEVERVRAFFQPLAYESLVDLDPLTLYPASAASHAPAIDSNAKQDRGARASGDRGHDGASAAFKAWYRYNTKPHKVPGYRVVFVSLKAHGEAPGDMTDAQMDTVADLADRYSFGYVRATHNQNLLLADVRQKDLYALWRALEAQRLATANIGTLTDMICCPGLDFCSLANAGAIPIAKQIHAHFNDLDYLYDLGEIEIKISGCMNACGHHHVGHIGILGVDKHGEEWYQITIGGSASEQATLGEVIGPSVAKAQVATTIQKLIDVYVEQRIEEERFIDTVRRIGVEPFRERVYGSPAKEKAA
jgi:sulfite reductase (NADPH) hemoprotein beta-component